jgi:hypothetical protein
MKITKVTVKYGRTFSLPGYSNVKPEVGYEAEIEPGEDVAAVKAELKRMAQAEVEEACDQALEEGGNPAHFDRGPRYDAIRVIDEKYIAIVPAKADLPELWDKSNRVESGWRLTPLVKHLIREWSSYLIEDYSQNPESLPELAQVQLILTRKSDEADTRYCIALPYSVEADDLGNQYRYLPRRYHTVFAAGLVTFISKYAQDNEAELIDALDGDLSKLPKLEAPKPKIEPGMDESIDDDDEDSDEDYFNDDDDNGEDEVNF